jgi:bifunctional UDP-N-acetylglucosamine pyrophosphorylase/glucosamine-1-phosphate N-acetyltransferase
MIGHVLDNLASLKVAKTAVVIAPGMESVAKEVAPHPTAIQQEQLGTAHAAAAARDVIGRIDGTVLVLFGDSPFISAETIGRMVQRRAAPSSAQGDHPAVVVLGMRPKDPGAYGRLITDDKGNLSAIVEYRDADEKQRAIGLCNSGVMAIDGAALWELIDAIENKNAKQEYYLTSIVGVARARGLSAVVVEAPADELVGINSRAELAAAEALCQERLRARAFDNGVTMTDPASVFLCADTRLGRDVTIGPNVVFGPGVTVADTVEIHAFCHIEGAAIESGAVIGPYARLRSGSRIGPNAKVGNFVETKNTTLGQGAKANHLTYLGDAEVGAKSNIGAGTITCNYDGFLKEKTTIGANAFIGSNAALVAPVTIGAGAIVAAGSVITRDVEADAMAVARGPQVDKPGWAAKFRAARAAFKKSRS